jgi:tRNA 2-thiouridine synthesizing protein E
MSKTKQPKKTFELDADEWDEHYAGHRAFEMKIPGGKLSKLHWQVIHYLRRTYYKTGKVPTAAEACETNDMEIGELEALFPDGYHLWAEKIAGLRLR